MANTGKHPTGRAVRARSLLTSAVTGILVVAGTAFGPVPPAIAGTGAQDPWGLHNPRIKYQGPTKVGNCTVYANRGGFGSLCMTSHGDSSSIEKLLKEHGLPDCWHEPLSDLLPEEDSRREDDGEPGSFWLETCLKGVDLSSPHPDLSKIVFDYSVVWIPAGQAPVLLTEEQKALRDWLDRQHRDFPATAAITSPVLVPRVGQPIAFHLINARDVDGSPPPPSIAMSEPVPMKATLVNIMVHPVPGSDEMIICTGSGTPIAAGETGNGRPDVCAWKYQHSSAGQGQQATYEVPTSIRWDVFYQQDDGHWEGLNTIIQETVIHLRVTEVQTLVVPQQVTR
ncbi:MAG: hypothetical protein QG608_143 [Actinomycetota bacterium]|nr:hypothetical protein [Actinomycetota bacterium]